jgi:hypothetical protein
MAFVWPSPGERPKKADAVTFYSQAGENVTVDSHVAALLRARQLVGYNPYATSRYVFMQTGVTTTTAALSTAIGPVHGALAQTSGEVAIGDGDSSPWVWMADSETAVDGTDVLGFLDVGRWHRQGSTGATSTGYIVPGHGVAGTGLVDDSPAIAALESVLSALGGGTITFTPGTYLLSTNLTSLVTTTYDVQNRALFEVASGVVLDIRGSLIAPSGVQIFDVSASVIPTPPVASTAAWARVLLAGKSGVLASWFGALNDDYVTDNLIPLTIWLNSCVGTSLATSGCELVLDSPRTGFFGTSGLIIARSVNGGVIGNLTIRGTRGFGSRIKHMVDATSITNPEGLGVLTIKFESGSNANIPYNLVVEDISVEGNSGADRSKAIYFGFFNNAYFDRVQIKDTGGEGICSPGASTQVKQHINNCRAINIGREGLVAAFNLNAQSVHITGCLTEYCGKDIEHTGRDFFITGNVFKYPDSISVMACSTVFSNGQGVIADNIIIGAPTGLAIAAQEVTLGNVLVHHNTLIACGDGINVGASIYSKGAVTVENNLLLSGTASATAILLNHGKTICRNNTIQRVHGATGFCTAAAPTATLNGGATTGTWADKQYTGTVSSTTGLSVGSYISFATDTSVIPNYTDNHIYRITAINGLSVTLHKPKYRACTGLGVFTPHVITMIGAAATSGNGLYTGDVFAGYTMTVVGLSGTYTVLDTEQEFVGASNLAVRVDATPNTTVSNALVTYSSAPWAYCVRSTFDEGCLIEGNHTIGLAWTTAWCAQTGWLNTTTENNTFDLDGQDPTGMTVLQVRDLSNNEAGRLRHGTGAGDYIRCQEPWGYSGTKRSFATADGWPTSLTWKIGDRIDYALPTAGSFIGLVCTGEGTAGTLVGKTGTLPTGTDDLTMSPNANAIVPGMYLAIATVTDPKRVDSIAGAVLDLDTNNADPTATAQAVTFSAPTTTTWGPTT